MVTRLHGRNDGPMPVELACDAYPDGIPDAIIDNEVDHRQPHDGDGGLTFVKIPTISTEMLDQMLTETLQRYADRDTADLHAAAMVAAIEACLAATQRT